MKIYAVFSESTSAPWCCPTYTTKLIVVIPKGVTYLIGHIFSAGCNLKLPGKSTNVNPSANSTSILTSSVLLAL